jgi:hypothetical protein
MVLNSRRDPVPGATVMLHGGSNYIVTSAIESEEDGTFSFHRLGATGDLNLQAKNDRGLISPYLFFSLPEEGLRNVELIIESASVVMGAVLDGEGAPVPNIRVAAVPNGNKRVYGAHATSDDSGHYSLKGLAAGTYELNLPAWPGHKIAGAAIHA